MKNRIYFFTGTGNSLKASKDIAGVIGECELVPIKKDMDMAVPNGYERIGFIFPVYYWGPPAMVVDFLRNAKFAPQGDTYYFAIATFGALPGVAPSIVRDILKEHNITLNYGGGVKMFANGVYNYNMSKRVEKITRRGNARIATIVPAIVSKTSNKIRTTKPFMMEQYQKKVGDLKNLALDFNVNDSCIKCGLCRDICPANNITLDDGVIFGTNCGSCLACIQRCPQKAINHTSKTIERRRYQHPQISNDELLSYYKED